MVQGKVAVITGASRGIGKAIALDLAASGAKIVATARSLSNLEVLVHEITANGGEAIAVQADISVAEDVKSIFASAVDAFGRVDILVNNAGITKDGLLLRMKDEDWDQVLDTNLKSAFLCTRAAVKLMGKQKWGRIINISSVVGEMGNPGQANYCASKAGLIGFTKSVALEFARRNITVNAVTPGYIASDMTDELPEETRAELAGKIPLGRIGETKDISAAVLFLASENAGYITGQVLGINGGMYM